MDGVLFGGGVVIFKFLCLIGWEKGRGICKGDGVGIVQCREGCCCYRRFCKVDVIEIYGKFCVGNGEIIGEYQQVVVV